MKHPEDDARDREREERLDEAIASILSEPAMTGVRERLLKRAASWTAATVPHAIRWRPPAFAGVAIAASIIVVVCLIFLRRGPGEMQGGGGGAEKPRSAFFEAHPIAFAIVADEAPILASLFGPRDPVSLGGKVMTRDETGKLLVFPDALHVWDWTKSRSSRVRNGVAMRSARPLALSPDGKMLVSLWGEAIDLETGERKDFPGFGDERHRVHSIRFSVDGKSVALLVWSYEGKPNQYERPISPSTRILEWTTGKLLRELPAPLVHLSRWLAFAPDGRSVVLGVPDAASQPRDVRLERRDLATGDVMTRFEPALKLVAIAISPDGRYVCGSEYYGHLFIWRTDSGKLVKEIAITRDGKHDPFAQVEVMQFSPDGRYLAAAPRHKALKVYETATGREVAQVPLDLPSFVTHLRWSKDGQAITIVTDSAHEGGGRLSIEPQRRTPAYDIYPAVYRLQWKEILSGTAVPLPVAPGGD